MNSISYLQNFQAMIETQIFKCCRFLSTMIVINTLFLIKNARSAVYTVGDEQGWNSEVNYDSWSRKYNFSVGDILVFQYTRGQHNAYEVMEATYRSCDASTGVLARYESGNDEAELKEAKKHWFICNVDGHCPGGMRLYIDVRAANSTSHTNSTNGAFPPQMEPIPPANSLASGHAFTRWSLWIYCLVAFGIFTKFI